MRYLVLGGNAAGMSFAAKMRRNQPKAEVIVIEKRNYVSFGGCGLPYYVADHVKNSEHLIVRSPEKFIEQNIDLRIEQEVLNINTNSKEVEIKQLNEETYNLTYDKLIIATGASPITLFNIDVDYKNVFTLTSKEDGIRLKETLSETENKKIAIIGSGFIGLELMDSLCEFSHNMSIITRDKNIVGELFDEQITEEVQKEIKNKSKINLMLEQNIKNIEKVDNKVLVTLESQKLEFDYLIFAVGFRPNSIFIQSVDKLPNGAIITDDNMETNITDVYAIGDVATSKNIITNKQMYVPLATTANKTGKALADKLSKIDVPYIGMLGASILKIFDYEIGRVGLTKKQILDEGIKFKEKIVSDYNQTSHYPGQEKIIAKIYYDENSLQILGIEMSGKKGVHGRLDAMSVVIMNKMTTKQLGYIDFAYAPPFARTWDFLNVIGNVSK